MGMNKEEEINSKEIGSDAPLRIQDLVNKEYWNGFSVGAMAMFLFGLILEVIRVYFLD